MSDAVTSVEKHGTPNLTDQAEIGRLLVRGGDEHFEVRWDTAAKVTPAGALVFFAQYVQTGGLLDRLCQGSLLETDNTVKSAEAVVAMKSAKTDEAKGQTGGRHSTAERTLRPRTPGRGEVLDECLSDGKDGMPVA